MAEFSLFLYYKPGPDMGIEGEENFDPAILKEQGKILKEYLEKVSNWLSILKNNGWKYQGTLYDIICYKDISKKEALVELKKLGIDVEPDSFMDF